MGENEKANAYLLELVIRLCLDTTELRIGWVDGVWFGTFWFVVEPPELLH